MSNNLNALVMHPDPGSVTTGVEARRQFRDGRLAPYTQTTGMARGYMQGSPAR